MTHPLIYFDFYIRILYTDVVSNRIDFQISIDSKMQHAGYLLYFCLMLQQLRMNNYKKRKFYTELWKYNSECKRDES